MKDYIKKLMLRISILIIIIIILAFGLEFILSHSKTRKEHNEWIQEDILINKMNTDKLQNKDWSSNPLWIHEGETLPEKKENVKRILIIGDSYIWGDGYDNANHIWWQQLRQKLKQSGYNEVEVIAVGCGGYSTQLEFEDIIKNTELISTINPDLIIFGYVENDPEFKDENYQNQVKKINSEDLLYDNHNFLTKIYKKSFPYTYNSLSLLLSNKFEKNAIFQKYFGLNYFNFTYSISSGTWLNKYENDVIVPLKNYIESEYHIPYMFYITSMEETLGLGNILAVFDKHNIDYYLAFRNRLEPETNLKINPVNWHPSTALCNSYAETLLEILEEDYKYILGNKSTYEPIININDWMPYKLNVNKVNKNTFNFVYPDSNDKNNFLHLPIRKNYIKLNLEEPINLKNISITGDNIEEIEVFITKINKNLEYDDKELFSLGNKNDNFIWSLDDNELVTSINISAKIKNKQQSKLTITLDN